MTPRVVVGISGASGAAIGVRVVELLAEAGGCELHLVVSSAAERTLAQECGAAALDRLATLTTHQHPIEDIGAAIASGSFRTMGMIVAPCSMRTLAAIAFTAADNLLVRAADVTLKERRPLVLLARESPLHLGHLRAMATVTGSVAVVESWRASMNSFHVAMNARIAVVNSAGAARGSRTRRKACPREAPSTRAASSSSHGSCRKKDTSV